MQQPLDGKLWCLLCTLSRALLEWAQRALQGRGAVSIPLPDSVHSQLEGRCSAAYVGVLGGIVLVSYCGRFALPIAGQIQTLSALGEVVRGCGLPVIIGGDWQISPEVLAQSKFPHRLGAEIVAAASPTNLRSGSTLDYFLVSRSIRAAVASVEAHSDLHFSPHVPDVITLSSRAALGITTAMAQSRLLPSGHPHGPMPRAATVDWTDFEGQG